LSAEEKYQIFLEATMAKAKQDGSISEVLSRAMVYPRRGMRAKVIPHPFAIGGLGFEPNQPVLSGGDIDHLWRGGSMARRKMR